MKNKILSLILSVLCVATVIPAYVYAGESHTETVTYESNNSEEKYNFEKKIKKDGKSYKLVNVDYDVAKNEAKKVEHIEKSEPVVPGSAHQFLKTMEVEGVTYQLENVREVESSPFIQDVTAYTDFEYVVTSQSVPQSKTITVKNEKTGADEMVECNISNVNQIGKKWIDSYIDIQFKNYNSTSFDWQGLHIANNFSSAPLAGYELQLLESVGLTSQTGTVKTTYWTSEAYIVDGVMCREARADISKEVPVYRANYNGQIKTPLVTQEAVYIGKGMVKSDNDEYTIKATAYYEEDTMRDFVKAASLFLLLILIIAFVMIVTARKKLKNKIQKICKKNNINRH